jgi:small subunit ribosomal protein S1
LSQAKKWWGMKSIIINYSIFINQMENILDQLAKEVDKISEEDISKDEKTEQTEVTEKKPAKNEADDSPMGKLMSKKAVDFPRVGDVVEGKVIDVTSSEIYLDLAPFGTGIVLGKEIKDGMASGKAKIGDKVTATIMDLEDENGYIELSIREASHEKAWEDIESKRDTQEKITTKIINANKGGLLIEVNGISGFLPVSQLSSKNYPRVEDGDKNKILTILKKMIGREIEVRILDADKETQKLIASEKAAQSEKDKEIISNLHVGDTVSGEVSGVVDFGAFIKFSNKGNLDEVHDEDKLEGLVHISELAWQLIEDPRSIIKVGDKVQAKIIGIDADKISLSIRALQKDPWSEIGEKYGVGDIVSGTVNKINHFGAFVYLDKDIHGLAHISEMSEMYPGKNIDELIKTGEKYDWKILSIEPRDHRMGLVLTDKKKAKKEKEIKEEKPAKKTIKAEKEEKEVKKEKEIKKVKKETPKKKTKKEKK